MASFTLPQLDEGRQRAAEREAERLDFLKLQARLATERPGARWTPAQTTVAAGFPLLCIARLSSAAPSLSRREAPAVAAPPSPAPPPADAPPPCCSAWAAPRRAPPPCALSTPCGAPPPPPPVAMRSRGAPPQRCGGAAMGQRWRSGDIGAVSPYRPTAAENGRAGRGDIHTNAIVTPLCALFRAPLLPLPMYLRPLLHPPLCSL